jgi:Domain of unknown function (DUF4402)
MKRDTAMNARQSSKVLFVGALMGFAPPVLAQSTASQSATGTTKIVQPITLTKVSDLAFGTLVRSTSISTNTVTVDPSTGARALTGSGDGVLVASTVSRAAFTVGGEGGQTFSVTVPSTFTMTSGANNITVTLATTGATGTISGTIGSAGTATIGVGGNFSANNAQAGGAYSGSFTTTVAYN